MTHPLVQSLASRGDYYRALADDRFELIKDLQELARVKLEENKFGEWQELNNIIRKHLDAFEAIMERFE